MTEVLIGGGIILIVLTVARKIRSSKPTVMYVDKARFISKEPGCVR